MLDYTKEKKIQLVRLFLAGRVHSTLDLVREGLWTAQEREQNAADVIDGLKPSEPSATHSHLMVVLGGGPMSGKSTIRQMLFERTELQNTSVQISSDRIRPMLPEYAIMRNLAQDQDIVNELQLTAEDLNRLRAECYDFVMPELQQITSQAVETFSAQGVPIVMESHMENPKTVMPLLQAAKAHRYDTVLIAPDVDVPTFFDRGQKRLEQTGKRFPVKPALEDQKLFEAHWPAYASAFDGVCRIDNNGTDPNLMALAMNGEMAVLNIDSYLNARKKVGINTDGANAEEVAPRGDMVKSAIDSEIAKINGSRQTTRVGIGVLNLFKELISDSAVPTSEIHSVRTREGLSLGAPRTYRGGVERLVWSGMDPNTTLHAPGTGGDAANDLFTSTVVSQLMEPPTYSSLVNLTHALCSRGLTLEAHDGKPSKLQQVTEALHPAYLLEKKNFLRRKDVAKMAGADRDNIWKADFYFSNNPIDGTLCMVRKLYEQLLYAGANGMAPFIPEPGQQAAAQMNTVDALWSYYAMLEPLRYEPEKLRSVLKAYAAEHGLPESDFMLDSDSVNSAVSFYARLAGSLGKEMQYDFLRIDSARSPQERIIGRAF